MSGTTAPTSEHTPSASELVAAWRALRYGGVDEQLTDLAVPPTVAASLPTFITSLRWGTVLFGMVYAAPRAAHGDLAVVGSLSLMLFLTSWRSSRPLKLGATDALDRAVPVTDAVIAGLAIGLSGGLLSPFAPAAVALPPIAALGWGLVESSVAIGGLLLGVAGSRLLAHHDGAIFQARSWWVIALLVAFTLIAVAARRQSLAAEVRRAALSGQVETLTDANDLLSVLARVARTLPNAYNLHDALDRVRVQLTETFSPHGILFVSPAGDDAHWRTEITAGIDCNSVVATAELPAPLRAALTSTGIEGLPGALATTLRARGEVIGLLMITAQPDQPYAERHQRLLQGLSDVLALTIDNGRLFGRLRSFGAEAERSRIARDLHDRLGQWLTYISLELERIGHREWVAASEDIERLHRDVQSAMTELRETFRDLRTEIGPDRSFDVVAVEVLERFHERTGVAIDLDITSPGGRLDIETEHELLRILQEALHNIDKHAHASVVDVTWSVNDAGARLVVVDDGRGFDAGATRPGSYGLVGMQERASGIGATMEIQSRPGAGTTLVVETTMERAR